MKLGLFGYTGDSLSRTQAMVRALTAAGADRCLCLGGLVWTGGKDEEQGLPGTVLRWLRSEKIFTLSNDNDRQVAGWRMQALVRTTGFIRPHVRRFLAGITREEAQWIYERPTFHIAGKVACCADILTMDAVYPVPLTRYNAQRLFDSMEQRAAFFPSAYGPSLIVRKQQDGALEASAYASIEERLDTPKTGALIGGVCGITPHQRDVCWGAVADDAATQITLVCLDAKTLEPSPERGRVLLTRAALPWRE